MKKIITFAVIIALMLAFAVPVSASGNVTYEGSAKSIIFSPGSTQSPTDLFENFKNVMPGDSLKDKIILDNKGVKNATLKVYIRSLGAQKGTDPFLSEMTLTVKQENASELFNAPANETAQLTDWVLLGTIKPGGKTTLDLTLNIPIEMSNDFQSSIGYIDWQFKVEEVPNPVPPTPKTGDEANLALWIAIIAVCLIGIAVLFFLLKKKQKEQDNSKNNLNNN